MPEFQPAVINFKRFEFDRPHLNNYYWEGILHKPGTKQRHTEDDLNKINNPNKFCKELNHIEKVIEDSKYILNLEDDWDSEGAQQIPEIIFNRAIDFIRKYSKNIFEDEIIISAPIISPLRDGSIDLLWQSSNSRLLLNIKNTSELTGFFYGALDIHNTKNEVYGNIETDIILPSFKGWLMEYKMGG